MASVINESMVRERALERVRSIFAIPGSVSLGDRFGIELVASFVSDFKENEIDKIDNDIHDVADRSVQDEFESEQLVIRTVGDYCDLMVRCSRSNPKEVAYLLGLDLFR
ncbi:hypothetical protein [Lysobacter sp. Root667]|uniref:hypothetical protein n=1 Tax=Lysobacter sp. Root667 TaxID=1736581 RepID=UPI0009EA3949|nr:hypothetical protein [Lysobacter sp. Root667]